MDNDNEESQSLRPRKKRLSRKQQKALKKQRKNTPAATTFDDSSRNNVSQNNGVISKNGDDRTTDQQSKFTTKSAPPAMGDIQSVDPSISYTPTPLPEEEDLHHHRNKDDTKQKTLGKWFPKARVTKSRPSTTDKCTILLFYQYTHAKWSEVKVGRLLQYLERVALARPFLAGRLRVAPEGVNATISCGDPPAGGDSRTELDHFCRDLQRFDPVFCETDFKFLTGIAADRHFKDLKVLPVKELVFYGISDRQAPLMAGGVHLPAHEFHNMLQDTSQQTVVIDVRNHYEAVLGRFDGQQHQKATHASSSDKQPITENTQKNDSTRKSDDNTNTSSSASAVGGGALYIDPKMRKSTDFPKWVHESKEFLKGKRVMMYCTGGVRCERASAFIKMSMGDDVKGVYQLQGGIERYMQAFPDGGHWRGKNFVFDKREAVGVDNPNGDGGVLQNNKKKRKETREERQGDVVTKCCLCDAPWDRYVGKRKCDTCGVPVLMCDACMASQKGRNQNNSQHNKDGNNSKEDKSNNSKLARCPLCVEEGITVPVDEVEYTANGVKSNYHGGGDDAKVAPSVLKWGGGHAQHKKTRRRHQRQRGGSLESGSERETAKHGRSDSLGEYYES